MISKKALYKSPKIQIPNNKYVVVDIIDLMKVLIVFSYYIKTLDSKFIIKVLKLLIFDYRY